jgi:hypothetical protein
VEKDVYEVRKTLAIWLLLIPAIAFSQKVKDDRRVTVMLGEISLEEALTVLSISYDVTFSYSDDIIPSRRIISLSIQNERLEEVLDKLLPPLGIGYKVSRKRIILKKSDSIPKQTIRGTVIDPVTRAPIPGSTITVLGTDPLLGTRTDEDGKFRISNVPVGRISISTSSIGFDPHLVPNVLLTTGKELVVDIQLKESVTPMEEVVVIAKRNDGIPGNGLAVTSGRSFSVEDTKRYAGSLGDPARMATAFAGVTGASDECNSLIVRGNSPRGVLWRVEGIEIPNPNHFTTEGASSGVIGILSPNMIENSDFLTGAFPAQYGNALSAVFDIHLRNGNNERREHSLQAGMLGIEATTEGPFSKKSDASYLVNYRFSSLSLLDHAGVELNEAAYYKKFYDLSFKINVPVSPKSSIALFGLGGESPYQKNGPNFTDDRNSGLGVMGLTLNSRIRENTVVNASFSLANTAISKHLQIDRGEQGMASFDENYDKTFIRQSISLRRKISDNYFLESGLIYSMINFDFHLTNADPGNLYQTIINFGESGRTSVTQGFLFARQYFSSRLFAHYGAHLIHFNLSDDYSIEPRFGLQWQASSRDAISFSYGKHSKVENLQYYLARDHQTGGNEVQVNKDLGFTRSHHFVMGYERLLTASQKLKIETYYQRLFNVPVQANPSAVYATINEDTGFITDTLLNNGKGTNYGVEISWERNFDRNFYYLINGSFYQSLFSSVGQVSRNTAYNGNYSVHLLAGKEFELRQRQRLGFNMKFTMAGGRRYVPIDLDKSTTRGIAVYDWSAAFEEKLPEYFRADFQVVYRTNRPRYGIEWRLDLQNFTNHRNAAYYYFDVVSEDVKLKRQVGIIPMLTCKVEF